MGGKRSVSLVAPRLIFPGPVAPRMPLARSSDRARDLGFFWEPFGILLSSFAQAGKEAAMGEPASPRKEGSIMYGAAHARAPPGDDHGCGTLALLKKQFRTF